MTKKMRGPAKPELPPPPPKTMPGPKPLFSEAELMQQASAFFFRLRAQGLITYKRIHVGGKIIRGRVYPNPEMEGMADWLVLLRGGKTLHIEMKAANGRQRAEQYAWQKELEGLGHVYAIVRSLSELEELLVQHGVNHWSFARGQANEQNDNGGEVRRETL